MWFKQFDNLLNPLFEPFFFTLILFYLRLCSSSWMPITMVTQDPSDPTQSQTPRVDAEDSGSEALKTLQGELKMYKKQEAHTER